MDHNDDEKKILAALGQAKKLWEHLKDNWYALSLPGSNFATEPFQNILLLSMKKVETPEEMTQFLDDLKLSTALLKAIKSVPEFSSYTAGELNSILLVSLVAPRIAAMKEEPATAIPEVEPSKIEGSQPESHSARVILRCQLCSKRFLADDMVKCKADECDSRFCKECKPLGLDDEGFCREHSQQEMASCDKCDEEFFEKDLKQCFACEHDFCKSCLEGDEDLLVKCANPECDHLICEDCASDRKKCEKCGAIFCEDCEDEHMESCSVCDSDEDGNYCKACLEKEPELLVKCGNEDCDSWLCSDHAEEGHRCKVCGKLFCEDCGDDSDNLQQCSQCEEYFCKDCTEKDETLLAECESCNDLVCKDCAPDNGHKCSVCEKKFCGNCEDDNLFKCKVCGNKVCEDCKDGCSDCDEDICKACLEKDPTLLQECPHCEEKKCKECWGEEEGNTCAVCKKKFCSDCAEDELVECKACKKKVCEDCRTQCGNCDDVYCEACAKTSLDDDDQCKDCRD